MRYSGIQPQYFPRLHYLARILDADIFMVRDEVQFVVKHKYPRGRVDKSYQAHTPIKHSSGRFLLTIPTEHLGYRAIMETKPVYQNNWVNDHLKTVQFSYSKSLNFNKLFPELEALLSQKYANLSDLNLATIYWAISHLLGVESIDQSKLNLNFVNKRLKNQKKFRLRQIRKASESKSFKGFKTLGPNEKILALCQEVGATEDYCGGTSVASYVDHEIFEKNGIKLVVQDWICKEYLQQFIKTSGFIPNLSIIDLLMNVPIDEAQDIIKG